MCLFRGCRGSHVEPKTPGGIIKSESLQSQARGGAAAALGRTWHSTLQFWVQDSRRRRNMRRAAYQDEQMDGWRKRTCQTWNKLLFRWRLPGTGSCELFVTVGRKWQEGLIAEGGPEWRRSCFWQTPWLWGRATLLCDALVGAVTWWISALLKINKEIKWNREKTNEERRHVAAHILEWKNWAIICYFAVNISTLCLQPLK